MAGWGRGQREITGLVLGGEQRRHLFLHSFITHATGTRVGGSASCRAGPDQTGRSFVVFYSAANGGVLACSWLQGRTGTGAQRRRCHPHAMAAGSCMRKRTKEKGGEEMLALLTSGGALHDTRACLQPEEPPPQQ